MTSTGMPDQVRLVEVGPRDGLQNEKTLIATADKIELINRLSRTGLRSIEATSFVSPKWIPQLADAAEVFSAIQRLPGVSYPVLVPNEKGYERAREVGAQEVAVFTAASEAFNLKNINAGIDESIERFRPVAEAAKAHGMKVRAAVSCALGCPYEGEVSLDAVEDVVQRLLDIGSDHIGIADTIGVGTAGRVTAVMERALKHVPLAELSGHFHDTYGQALTNIYASLTLGVHIFDTSIAGLGGCPYAKGATGNVATEDVVYLLHGLGITTGIDLDALVDAGAFISNVLGRKPVSRVSNALLAKRANA